jgi:hypothetical protein
MGNLDRSAPRNQAAAPQARVVMVDDSISINVTKPNCPGSAKTSNEQVLSDEELHRLFTAGEGLIKTVRNLPIELKKMMGFAVNQFEGPQRRKSRRTRLFISLNDAELKDDGTESALNEIILEVEIPTEDLIKSL